MIAFKQRGSFNNTERFFKRMKNKQFLNALDYYGQIGVEALSSATPVDSGKTASNWIFEIEKTDEVTTISWINTYENDGVIIAVILQHGHGTGTGGYVQGRDYINPAMQPIFDRIAEEAWKGVVMS